MKLPIFTVDAFTSRPFSGNQAAVVPITQPLEDDVMQKVAAEMNLSETAFVRPLQGGGEGAWVTCGLYSLRWFTPELEIPLCGHATLATAQVLFYQLGYSGSRLQFETLGGVLEVRKDNDLLKMDFPLSVATPLTADEERQVGKMLPFVTRGLTPRHVRIAHRLKYLLIRLDDAYSRKDLENLKPNFSEMENAHDGSLAMGVIVSVAGGGDPYYDAFTRFFAPLYGVNEDPTTGSAYTVLGPYWAEQLGKKDLNFKQVSKRGGDIKVRVRNDGRVDISGSAVTVLEGHITV